MISMDIKKILGLGSVEAAILKLAEVVEELQEDMENMKNA